MQVGESYRAEVDDIPRQLGHDHLLDVGADLHVVAPARGAEVFHSGHLAGESHTPGRCQVGKSTIELCGDLVQWIHLVMTVLMSGPMFLSSTALLPPNSLSVNLDLSVPKDIDWSCRSHSPPWRKKVKTLLMIQQADLVTDGAVKGVVDQKELHHSLSSFSGEVGVSVHLPPLKMEP